MKGANNTYFGNIKEAVGSLLEGLRLSFRHLLEARESRKPMGIKEDNYFDQQSGIVTLQYPKESLPVPDNGRYRLHNEIEDCIVCDKCAKICPVDCIEIEPVKAVEEIGKTSDGTSKRLYAAKFDIDMGKCCFCGLCTTVCPTECLTMTKAYDFSEFDSADHIYAFSEMTPMEILQKKQALDEFNKQKEAEKAAKTTSAGGARPAVKPKPAVARSKTEGQPGAEAREASAGASPKPAFRPKIKPQVPKEGEGGEAVRPKSSQEPMENAKGEEPVKPSAAKPAFRPKIKPKVGGEKSVSAPKPVLKPKIKAKSEEGKEESTSAEQASVNPSPKPRPVMKPKIPAKKEEGAEDASGKEKAASASPATARPRPVIKPKVKSKKEEEADAAKDQPSAETGARPRPVMKPKIKSLIPTSGSNEGEQPAKSKPARPVIKPKMETKKEDKPEEGAPSEETKGPKPVVKPTGVPRKPAEEEKSESDKHEEQKVKPAYKPRPVIRKKKEE